MREDRDQRTKGPKHRTFGLFGSLVLCSFGFIANGAANPSFADNLTALAAKCDELGLQVQAEMTRKWFVQRYPGRQYLFLPVAGDLTVPKGDAPLVERQWHDRFMEIRREQAANLFAAAKALSAQGEATRAYQLLHEVLREDPEHTEAKRILGYAKDGRGTWALPGVGKLDPQVARMDHPKLNWKARGYWRLETTHFQIVTNHSAREAIEAAGQLEKLAALWRQVFFRYWSTPQALAARIAGGNGPLARERPKMQVVLFKSREEYVEQLTPVEPQIAMTVGYYNQAQRIAFFIAGDTTVYPTWYHEATHQLFKEAVSDTVDEPGLQQNFWAVEGAALYMESLDDHGSYWTVGGCDVNRLQFARYRGLSGEFLLPLARLAAMGRAEIQKSDEIRKIYGQAAGVAHFLLDSQGGKHGEALIDVMTAIYLGRDAGDSLVRATGQPWTALDEGYRKFLNVSDADLAGIAGAGRIRNLWLGQTSVTDKGLTYLADCRNLESLTLSGTSITDRGLSHIGGAGGLKQLFLERTKVTDGGLPIVGTFRQLEELDLSHLSITDEGLAAIAGLKNLKVLYLSGSPISDAGLTHLRGMRQLERLDADGTRITPDGLKKLKAALPKLKAA
jgi:hypothetical protein